jgi:hypothetical protein
MDQSKVQEISSTQPQRKHSMLSSPETRRSKVAFVLTSLPYIYALGNVEVCFPNKSIENEYIQSLGLPKTTSPIDNEAFYSVLSQPQNRYLAHKLSWVLTRDGKPIYILLPTSPEGLDALLEAIRPSTSPLDRSVIIGRKGPVAPPSRSGLEVPMVLIDHIFSFDYDNFQKSIPSESFADEKLRSSAEEMFQKMMQIANNKGATGKHRALNYLAVRYPAIYVKAAQELERNFSLTSVEADSTPSDNRKIISVVFSFSQRETGAVKRYFVRVDVTEEFPFIVTEMSPCFVR